MAMRRVIRGESQSDGSPAASVRMAGHCSGQLTNGKHAQLNAATHDALYEMSKDRLIAAQDGTSLILLAPYLR